MSSTVPSLSEAALPRQGDGIRVKRAFDFLLSALGLLLLWPLLVIISVTVAVDSGLPILHRGMRIGRDGIPFRLLKFRTMVRDAERQGGPITSADDARITALGALLRRLKVDELPSLWNVLRGQMSLVGPRPESPEWVARYTAEQRRVLALLPGITGVASLKYRHEQELLAGAPDLNAVYFAILQDKLALELRYLEDRTLRGDFVLLIATLRAIFR